MMNCKFNTALASSANNHALQPEAGLARHHVGGCASHEALAAAIVLLVTEQLGHVPARLQDYCRRDTFSMGYAIGAVFSVLQNVDTPVPKAIAAKICLVVFEQLYGDDASVLFDRAVQQTTTAEFRFMAGIQAGACDLVEWLDQRVSQYRLAKEFSLCKTLD